MSRLAAAPATVRPIDTWPTPSLPVQDYLDTNSIDNTYDLVFPNVEDAMLCFPQTLCK